MFFNIEKKPVSLYFWVQTNFLRLSFGKVSLPPHEALMPLPERIGVIVDTFCIISHPSTLDPGEAGLLGPPRPFPAPQSRCPMGSRWRGGATIGLLA